MGGVLDRPYVFLYLNEDIAGRLDGLSARDMWLLYIMLGALTVGNGTEPSIYASQCEREHWARVLGVSDTEVKAGIARLVKHEFLNRAYGDDGKLLRCTYTPDSRLFRYSPQEISTELDCSPSENIHFVRDDGTCGRYRFSAYVEALVKYMRLGANAASLLRVLIGLIGPFHGENAVLTNSVLRREIRERLGFSEADYRKALKELIDKRLLKKISPDVYFMSKSVFSDDWSRLASVEAYFDYVTRTTSVKYYLYDEEG